MSSTASDFKLLPRHVGVIMDGNGRWAKLRGLARSEGHRQGAEVFRTIATYASDLGLEAITFYAFSTENWSRPMQEVSAIMNLFRDFLVEAQERHLENSKRGFRIRFIGDIQGLPEDIVDMVRETEDLSASQVKTNVNIAVNYGGRQEIVHAVKALAQKLSNGEISAADIDEQAISDNLYTVGLPEPDLIIRPSGEYRLSNFLTWQSAYSEFWFSDVLWPDFTKEDFDKALHDYEKRNRRFGGV